MKNAHRQTLSFSLRQLLNCYSPQCFAHSLMLDGTHVQLYASKVLFTLTYIISMYVTLSWFYLCTSKCHKLESNRVIRKVVERGHMNSSLAKIGDETRNWAWKKYKGVERGAKLNFGWKLKVKWVWSQVCAHQCNFLCSEFHSLGSFWSFHLQ